MYTKVRDIFQDKHEHYRSIMEMHSAGEGETDRRQADKQGAARQTKDGHRTGKEKNRKTNIRQIDNAQKDSRQTQTGRQKDKQQAHIRQADGHKKQTESRRADKQRTGRQNSNSKTLGSIKNLSNN